MNTIIKILLIIIALMLWTGCCTHPKPVPQKEPLKYGLSLEEVLRSGKPQNDPYPGYHNKFDYTCHSRAIFNLYGEYEGTDVRCY